VETGRTGHRLGGKIPRAIAGHYRVSIQQHHLFKRLPTLELPKDARAHRAEPRGGDRLQDLAPLRVTRDTLEVLWYFPEYKIAVISTSYADMSVSQNVEKNVTQCARPLRFP
jgi:hypothetical protein